MTGAAWLAIAVTLAVRQHGDAMEPKRPKAPKAGEAIVLEAEDAQVDQRRAEVVEQPTFDSRKGVALRAGQTANVGSAKASPDLVFKVTVPRPGRYWIRSHAAVDAARAEAMKLARGKNDSLRLTISAGGGRPTSRVVFVPWSPPGSCRQALGKFDLDGREQEIRIWLPEGVRLDRLEVEPYLPPKVPAAAEAYRPTVVPPASRPRLWVNRDSLPQVRANLDKGDNAARWARVRGLAAKRFDFKVDPGAEVGSNTALEGAAAAKAFVYLMTGDRKCGREAVELARDYLAAVEFGNLLDITRQIGSAIHSGALVYDWCYDLMTPEERTAVRRNLMRLADDMEMGWPPFRQSIVNGHGNEAQLNRDLLSMAIAIYDEDPVPYRYCAYRVLEELVPMRRFEYRSPRHNQGASYGPYRLGWDMHSAWLFRRMTGKPVFDPGIGEVYKVWLYMRLPDGTLLRDGDGFADGRKANLGALPLLVSAYTADPIVKGDMERQGSRVEHLLFLLLNDPGLRAEKSLDSLPLSADFGPVLGSMIARTGWSLDESASDVVVEMKGGGWHFGNHQHSDAGSFQIWYRGLLAGDLGQYHFYGTPYDYNFCKRSVAHSMMLAVDPDEKFPQTTSNDGGTRFVRSCPVTPEQAVEDPTFANGTRLSSSFGPSPQRPFFSYFSVDLKSAYGPKIRDYVRSFCFLNLGDGRTPAALIVLDTITTAKPEFRKYWQVNSPSAPEKTAEGLVLRSKGAAPAGRVSVRMLRPGPEERELQILSGPAALNVFGQQFTPPFPDRPEAKGSRAMFSPKVARAGDVFLTVMTMSSEEAPDPQVALAEGPATFTLTLADRVVVLSRNGRPLEEGFEVDVPAGRDRQLLLTGLAPGAWSIRSRDGRVRYNARVEEGRNTAFFVVGGGSFEARPEAIPGAPEFRAAPEFVPAPGRTLPGK